MSTARRVPETVGSPGIGPLAVVASMSPKQLFVDSIARLRFADGFSHARAMAFQVVLTLVPASIAFVALAQVLDWESVSQSVLHITELVSPGAASEVFREAFEQGLGETSSAVAALIGGTVAAAIAGTTAYGQVERTANRIYGVEVDRSSRRKYTLAATMFAVTAVIVLLGLLGVGVLEDWRGANTGGWDTFSRVIIWPVAAAIVLAAFVVIFSVCPRRRQPGARWVAVGAAVTMVGFAVVSVALGAYLDASGSFGDTYGPLAGQIGALLWAYGIAIAVFLGVAVSAQIEAVRGGAADPRDAGKVELGEPDTALVPYGAALVFSEADTNHDHRNVVTGTQTKT